MLDPSILVLGTEEEPPAALEGALRTMEVPREGLGGLADAEAARVQGPFDPDAPAFVQFTSGSTGGAKGVVVTFRQLGANLASIRRRVGLGNDDRMVSWAPLYHDMGLMAVLLPLTCRAGLVLMATELFVKRPSSWLEAISAHGGTVSTAPPTALKLLSRRVARNVDLSTWRYAWIGGEMVFGSVLSAFETAYTSSGLRQGVLQPTYGMAETVVGISCGHPGEPWSENRGFVACGPALDDIEVRILDESDAEVDEGQTGRIVVRGDSVFLGYRDHPVQDRQDWFDTGDLGHMENGLLHISGRSKDILKRGGESFPATVVEAVAEEALGLATGRCAAFANMRAGASNEELVLLVEARDWDDDKAKLVAGAVLAELGLQMDTIRAARGGRLPRTSSGKLMRQRAAALHHKGDL